MERISRAKAIRLKCLDCCCDNMAEIRKCPSTNCPLWRYRMGKEENDELRPKKNIDKENLNGEELDSLSTYIS